MAEKPKKDSIDHGRRKALGKLGAYAAFTVPAVTGLLVSNRATAQSAASVDVGPGGVDVGVGGQHTHVDTGEDP